MTSRIITAILFALGLVGVCLAETPLKGLEPGNSTRSDVEKAFGQPLREVSATLSQYKSDKETEKIFVQYRPESDVVERVELLYSKPVERSVVISALNLPSNTTTSKVNSKEKLEEYFSTKYVMLTYATAEPVLVSRVGSYSQALFEKAIPKEGQDVLGPDQEGLGFTEEVATRLTYYPSPSVAACRGDCAKNPKCTAFSWIKPGFYNPGDSAMCYLMASWIKLVEQPCCISAVKPH